MAINRADISKQLIPGLNAVFGCEYKSIDNEHTPLFDIETSNRSFEEEVLMTGLETAPTKTEGAAVQYDDVQELWSSRYQHETIALAFAVTEEAMEDELYDTLSRKQAKFLGRAMANTKQVKAANVFNLAFSDNGGDGVPLFSATHPTRTAGSQSNTVSTDISEVALETALITISVTKDDRGILIGPKAKSLHIPPQLIFTAQKILGSEYTTQYRSGTGLNTEAAGDGISNLNDVNVLYTQGYFPGGIHVNHRFTDTDAWFIRTDIAEGTKMFVRKKLATSAEGDFDTGNFRFKARERYSFGHSDWRQWYGSDGA